MAKNRPVDEATLERVVHTIKAAWEDGCPVASGAVEIAPIAVRRFQSSDRRGVGRDDTEGRIRDLAEGLIAALEENSALIGRLKADYLYLARKIADTLLGKT